MKKNLIDARVNNTQLNERLAYTQQQHLSVENVKEFNKRLLKEEEEKSAEQKKVEHLENTRGEHQIHKGQSGKSGGTASMGQGFVRS